MQFGAESLLPPIIAIALAIATRKVILSLAIGVLIGAVLLASASSESKWVDGLAIFGQTMWESISDIYHLEVVVFTLLMGAMVGVMESGGSMRSLIAWISRRIRSRRGGQTLIATSGLIIFFDDYASTLLVGGTMRSTADRFGISREKLAYLVDSTSAPVAGLSLIGTWAAVELGYIAAGLNAVGIDSSATALNLFVESIPYRFYPWFALATVLIVSLTGRDFGPMRLAEQTAVNQPDSALSENPPARESRWLWIAAVFPVLGCIIAVMVALIVTGWQQIDGDRSAAMGTLRLVIDVLGSGDAYLALIIGSVVGLSMTLVLQGWIGANPPAELAFQVVRGAWQMSPAILILWFAWGLSAMTGDDQLNTGGYLASVLSDWIGPTTLPTIVFVTAAAVAFATGTSWGTMAILTPLSIELAFRLVADNDPISPIMLTTCGSVLAGAIFGDHCSPISDTTVLSSRASGCDHVAHVRTQMPYALTAGAVTILIGTIPASFGVPPSISLLSGVIFLLVIFQSFGKSSQKLVS